MSEIEEIADTVSEDGWLDPLDGWTPPWMDGPPWRLQTEVSEKKRYCTLR